MRFSTIPFLLATAALPCVAATPQNNEARTAVQGLLDYVSALDARRHEAITKSSSQHMSREDKKHLDQISRWMARVRSCGKDATPILQSNLKTSRSKWERIWLLAALAGARDERALSVFEVYARNDDADVRERAIWGLSLLGLPALKSLQQIAEDQKAGSRFKVLQAINEVVKAAQATSPERVADALGWSVGLLKDKDADVRFIAVHIVSLGDNSFTHHLTGALKDENETIRSEVVEILAKRNDVAAIPSLMQYLLGTDDRKLQVRHRIALAVAGLAKLELPPLEKRYKTEPHSPTQPYWVGEDRQIDHVLKWWNEDGKSKFELEKDKKKTAEQEKSPDKK